MASLKENYAHVTACAVLSSGPGWARLWRRPGRNVEEHPLPLLTFIRDGFRGYCSAILPGCAQFLIPAQKLRNAVGMAPKQRWGAVPGAEHYLVPVSRQCRLAHGLKYRPLATTPRHRFHALPQDLPEGDRAFAVKWLAWERKYLADRLFVEEILAEPGLGEVDGYSYATAQGAVLFLFNTSYDPREVHLRLHLKHDLEYIVREIHPRKYNYLGQTTDCSPR